MLKSVSSRVMRRMNVSRVSDIHRVSNFLRVSRVSELFIYLDDERASTLSKKLSKPL
jgi:hypothetical protein